MSASHFSMIHDLLDKISKDNKETLWRTLGEGLALEIMPTVDSLSEKYVSIHTIMFNKLYIGSHPYIQYTSTESSMSRACMPLYHP